jgi:hypothetical protein
MLSQTQEIQTSELSPELSPDQSFKLSESKTLFKILSSGLYTNKIRAVIREISCNAYDAHVTAKVRKPFEVTLPSFDDPVFRVRDYGPGIAPDDMDMYTTYGLSTKVFRKRSVTAGFFGIGAKSPFAYTSMFTVVSTWGGISRTYTMQFNDGAPTVRLIDTYAGEFPSGLEVSLVVAVSDIHVFWGEALQVLKFFGDSFKFINVSDSFLTEFHEEANSFDWKPEPLLGGNFYAQDLAFYYIGNAFLGEALTDTSEVFSNDLGSKEKRWHPAYGDDVNLYFYVVQGNVCYAVFTSVLVKLMDEVTSEFRTAGIYSDNLTGLCLSGYLKVPNNTFTPNPSREFLDFNTATLAALKKILHTLFITKFHEWVKVYIEDRPTFPVLLERVKGYMSYNSNYSVTYNSGFEDLLKNDDVASTTMMLYLRNYSYGSEGETFGSWVDMEIPFYMVTKPYGQKCKFAKNGMTIRLGVFLSLDGCVLDEVPRGNVTKAVCYRYLKRTNLNERHVYALREDLEKFLGKAVVDKLPNVKGFPVPALAQQREVEMLSGVKSVSAENKKYRVTVPIIRNLHMNWGCKCAQSSLLQVLICVAPDVYLKYKEHLSQRERLNEPYQRMKSMFFHIITKNEAVIELKVGKKYSLGYTVKEVDLLKDSLHVLHQEMSFFVKYCEAVYGSDSGIHIVCIPEAKKDVELYRDLIRLTKPFFKTFQDAAKRVSRTFLKMRLPVPIDTNSSEYLTQVFKMSLIKRDVFKAFMKSSGGRLRVKQWLLDSPPKYDGEVFNDDSVEAITAADAELNVSVEGKVFNVYDFLDSFELPRVAAATNEREIQLYSLYGYKEWAEEHWVRFTRNSREFDNLDTVLLQAARFKRVALELLKHIEEESNGEN